MLTLSLSLNPNFLHSCSLQTGVFFCVMNTVFNYSLLFKGLSYMNWLIFESIFLLSFSDWRLKKKHRLFFKGLRFLKKIIYEYKRCSFIFPENESALFSWEEICSYAQQHLNRCLFEDNQMQGRSYNQADLEVTMLTFGNEWRERKRVWPSTSVICISSYSPTVFFSLLLSPCEAKPHICRTWPWVLLRGAHARLSSYRKVGFVFPHVPMRSITIDPGS